MDGVICGNAHPFLLINVPMALYAMLRVVYLLILLILLVFNADTRVGGTLIRRLVYRALGIPTVGGCQAAGGANPGYMFASPMSSIRRSLLGRASHATADHGTFRAGRKTPGYFPLTISS